MRESQKRYVNIGWLNMQRRLKRVIWNSWQLVSWCLCGHRESGIDNRCIHSFSLRWEMSHFVHCTLWDLMTHVCGCQLGRHRFRIITHIFWDILYGMHITRVLITVDMNDYTLTFIKSYVELDLPENESQRLKLKTIDLIDSQIHLYNAFHS